MKILVPEVVAASGLAYLREKGHTVVNDRITTKDALIKAIADADGMLIRTLPCDREVLDAAKKIRVVAKHGIGYDNIDVAYCTQKGVQVVFTPQAICEAVSEHALFLMFACARNSRIVIESFAGGGDFEIRNRLSSYELMGKTVGIYGLGRIGRALAKICKGIGMTAIGFDPYVKQEQIGDAATLFERDEVLKAADFICMTLPCTDETRGGFGGREFKLMKKTAFFVNVSRGGVVNEPEMIEALRAGEILGAGLDVFVLEPPAADNPLLHMKNVYCSPHQAGVTVESMPKISLHAAIGIDEVLNGKAPSWPVNRLP